MGETAQTRTPEAQLFRDVFNASPIGIAVEDFDGRPIFVNPAFCSFLGFSEDQLCQKHCVDFSPREDAEKDWALFQQLKAGSIDHYQLEKRYFRRDGSLVWGRLTLSLLNGRSSPLVLAMVEDITDKKLAEEARFRLAAIVEDAIVFKTPDGAILSRNADDEERRLRGLLDVAPDAMVVADQAGRVVLVNRQTEKLFGYRQEEILGQPIEVLIPERFRGRHRGHRTKFSGDPRVRPMGANLQLFGLRKNGTEFPVEISLSPIQTADGILVTSAIRDITERKLAEESRLRLASIVESSEDAIISKNLDAVITSWNAGAQRIFGYTEAEAVGQPISILIPPELRDEENKILQELMAGEHIEHYESTRVAKTGKRINVSLTISLIRDSTGKIVGLSKIARDITERKRVEQELVEANERLGLALEAGSVGGWDYDLQSDKSVWFGTAHAQLGMTPDETSGSRKEFWERVHEDDRERVEHGLRIAKETHGEYAEDVRVVWRDGTTRWLRSRGRFQYNANGEAERSLGISLDITERKMAEERLREYEEAVEGAEDMIGVIDRQYRFLLANRQYLKMRNLSREQVVGHSITDVLGKEIFETAIKPKLDECFQGKVVRYEMKFSYPTAGERDLLLSYFPIEGANGIDRVACILHDITDRKQMEEALSEMSRKLIESQEQERSRIGRELHDDINQRLAMFAVELEQLQDNPSEVRNRVQELRKEVAELSNDVQALSHELHSSKLEYLGAVAGMKSWCREFSERQRLEIDFRSDVSSGVPLEIGVSLFRVLQEAVHNATKHSEVKRIEVELREESGEIHLIVRDSGKGFNVDTAVQGRGLGLTSMRERVRLVNGTIAIESKPMGGTTIHVRVPLASMREAQRAAG